MADEGTPTASAAPRGFLGWIERLGNLLPDPALLFVWGALIVILLSALAAAQGWTVRPMVAQTVVDAAGEPVIDAATGRPQVAFVQQTDADGNPMVLRARSLLTSEGIFWALDTMVANFIAFPPLGVVLVGMLGIGVAERTGLFAALLRALMLVVPSRLFTPMIVFLGIMSSIGSDSGYIVLPPLAAALYYSVGRSPLAGIAAAFAGIAAGFNANLLITGLDPLLAGLTTTGATIIDPTYAVAPTCNWGFMAASTIVMTFVGWFVTARLVEPRLAARPVTEGGAAGIASADITQQRLSGREWRALAASVTFMGLMIALVVVLTFVEGSPLHGASPRPPNFDRWVAVIVPIIFFVFLLPGLLYGIIVGNIRSSKHAATAMVDTIAAVAPIIVLAFFAAQFIEYFKYSQLDRMLAFTGGEMLARAGLPTWALLVAFIVLTVLFDLMIVSMSAKYTMMAPIFVPMFMVVGISPELTQAAYRIGDSVANSISPLNPYLIVILTFMQRYAKNTGIGTVLAMMLPYTLAFALVWTAMLLGWVWLDIPLGREGPLTYPN